MWMSFFAVVLKTTASHLFRCIYSAILQLSILQVQVYSIELCTERIAINPTADTIGLKSTEISVTLIGLLEELSLLRNSLLIQHQFMQWRWRKFKLKQIVK
jgi:hypothetical protein